MLIIIIVIIIIIYSYHDTMPQMIKNDQDPRSKITTSKQYFLFDF